MTKFQSAARVFTPLASLMLLGGCSSLELPWGDTNPAALHTAALVLDAHADIAIPSTSKSYQGADGRSKIALDKVRAGGMDVIVVSAATGPKPRTPEGRAAARALVDEKIAAAKAKVAADPGLVLARTADDLVRAHNSGKVSFLLGFQNAIALEGKVDAVDELFAEGVRVFAFNHIGHNDFSDSSRPVFDGATGKYEVSEEHGGLSELGRAAVARINALGGVIDVSQMSRNATLDAARISKTPVIASHSGVKMLSQVTRNLSDEEIDLIAGRGGVIHVAVFGAYLVDLSEPDLLARIKAVRLKHGLPEAWAYPYELYWELPDKAAQQAFLGEMKETIGTPDLDRLIDHIDYIVERVGIDHVGIGTDFNHGGGITGFMEADGAGNLTEALLKRGYSARDIKKIWGGNFLRVLGEAEKRGS